ncbi:TIGR03086 family metal-binding protein [Actinoallomurus purpureus]|uniref:TIGR03086 family metal-binding protein n=1 Tax=Actinoallomurus purpureus TaxID=478114 RepID=UPI002092ACFD|nr:TIGR03086 family metal-binding protein [Actinoallomurus purpureus]MCO6010489.1 TIGR03086 family metal-binding protein [Actinoallomurus purpureus]
MSQMIDLGPAAKRMSELLAAVPGDRLTAPTPCADYTLADLIDHVGGLSIGLAASARKDLGPLTSGGGSGDAARLGADWRARIPEDLAALAEAWRDPDAWQGMTQAGGVTLPADVMGGVVLDELVVHGWDVARSIGRPYDCDDREVDACLRFVSTVATPDPIAAAKGPFGPVAEVPADASPLDRLLGLTGRDPSWRSPVH